jgi:hypothetical protein
MSMKLTKNKLKRIIQEELKAVLRKRTLLEGSGCWRPCTLEDGTEGQQFWAACDTESGNTTPTPCKAMKNLEEQEASDLGLGYDMEPDELEWDEALELAKKLVKFVGSSAESYSLIRQAATELGFEEDD